MQNKSLDPSVDASGTSRAALANRIALPLIFVAQFSRLEHAPRQTLRWVSYNVLPGMMHLLTAGLLLAAAACAFGDVQHPTKPTTAQVAKLLGIDKSRVTNDVKPLNQRLQGKIHWLATYKISGEQDCAISLTLYPNDRIKTEFIEKIGENQKESQKIIRNDGDVIYHSLGDRGDQGTFYMTTLINHEDDWDMTLILATEPGVDETKLPFAIAKDGVKLIAKIEALLRKEEAEQGGGGKGEERR